MLSLYIYFKDIYKLHRCGSRNILQKCTVVEGNKNIINP